MKRKLFIIAALLIAFFLFGCSPKPVAEKDVEISITQSPAMTEGIEPTPTQKPSTEYCNSEEAEKALKRLIEISGTSDSEEGAETQPLEEITEADRVLAIAGIKEKQLELSLLGVPKCLQSAKEHLSNSFDGMIVMFTPDSDATIDDVMSNLTLISTEQQAFDIEIKRIQDCLPVECTAE